MAGVGGAGIRHNSKLDNGLVPAVGWGDRGQGTDGSLAWLQGEGLLASAWELWQPGYTV